MGSFVDVAQRAAHRAGVVLDREPLLVLPSDVSEPYVVFNGGIRTGRDVGQRASSRDLEAALREGLVLPYRKLAVDLGVVKPEAGLVGRVIELRGGGGVPPSAQHFSFQL